MKNNKKTIFIIIGIIAGFGLIALVLFLVLKPKQDKSNEEKEAKKEVVEENLSWKPAEFESFADRLYKAMYGGLASTAFDDVKIILNYLKNKDDWFNLVSVFGKRKDVDSWDFESVNGGLTEWLQYNFKDSQKAEISTILSKISVTW